MPWKRVTMSDDDLVANKHGRMQDEYRRLSLISRDPLGAAIWASTDMSDYYFSPMAVTIAADLIAMNGGIDCEAPNTSKLVLYAGRIGAGS